jgi:hypothetical protein
MRADEEEIDEKGNAKIVSHVNEASLLQLRVMSVCRYVISDALRKNKNVIDCL